MKLKETLFLGYLRRNLPMDEERCNLRFATRTINQMIEDYNSDNDLKRNMSIYIDYIQKYLNKHNVHLQTDDDYEEAGIFKSDYDEMIRNCTSGE